MITLFVGIETYGWGLSNFDSLIQFCKTHSVERVALKIYEITQGEWYSQFGGPSTIISRFKQNGIDVLPYGYFYGNDIKTETNAVNKYLAQYDQFCVNMEAEFDNQPDKVDAFVKQLTEPGILSVSTWSNPVSHGWSKNIGLLDSSVDVWMPQVYTDNLNAELYAQFPKVLGKIEPTYKYGVNPAYSSIYPNFSLWEYQDVLNNPSLLQGYQVQSTKDVMTTYPTNSKGMVANYLPVSQFQPGYSEYMCGPYAVSLNLRATPPNEPNRLDPLKVESWAESEYKKLTGSNGPNNANGVSVDQMHIMLKDSQLDSSGGLHYWDLPISAGSSQTDDIARIKGALAHGYPVIATITEASVYDMDLCGSPYWWGSRGNHIITYVGVASDGNLLVVDPANVNKGNLQGGVNIREWPRRYSSRDIQNVWATIVQPHWLPPIPSNDPLTWPAYQPPEQPSEQVTMTYDLNSKQIIFMVGNTAVYRIQA